MLRRSMLCGALLTTLATAAPAAASTPVTTPGTAAGASTPGSGAPSADGSYGTVVTVPAQPLAADMRAQIAKHLAVDQTDLPAFLATVGAPAFTPIVDGASIFEINTAGGRRDSADITWALAPADAKAVYEATVAALKIPASFEVSQGAKDSDGRTTYFGRWEAASGGTTDFPITTYEVTVASGETVSAISLRTEHRSADEAPMAPVPPALIEAAGSQLDAIKAASGLTPIDWSYRLGSAFIVNLGDVEQPSWETGYEVGAGIKAQALAAALCGADGAVQRDDTYQCTSKGENGKPNVLVTTSFDDSTLASRVTVSSPYST